MGIPAGEIDVEAALPPRWREVLVPVRGGADATARVHVALRIAAGIRARVTALYVVDERVLGDPEAGLVREQLHAQLTEDGQAVLEAARLEATLYEVEFAPRLEAGPVVETIVRVANEIKADVIVIGAHRQTWLGRLLGSSVAEAVLRAASCAVLAVPPLQRAGAAGAHSQPRG